MTNMLQAYFECGKNTQPAIRLYHQHFLNRTVPHYKKRINFLNPPPPGGTAILPEYYCGQKKWDINVIVLTFNVK
jgi:hypothetical protein